MTPQTFLVEIGTEELPPRALRALAESFATHFTQQLDRAELSHGEVSWFATPRRLALKVATLNPCQAGREVEKRGPAISRAYDAQGKPTKEAEGWARGCGISVDQAGRLRTDKGEWLLYRANVPGQSALELLAAMAESALSQLPVPKLMRWGDKTTQFVRPVHTVTLLLGSQLISGTVLGIQSDRVIFGHRFMGETLITVDSADHYPQILSERGHVIANYEARKAIIKCDVALAAKKLGGVADLSEDLLEEVTSLVEWPVVLVARFEEKFLAVPTEALVYTMKGDQKYFPVYDTQGKLMPHFIFVANIESGDPRQIISGNEKVVRPRLADAAFFFATDSKKSLETRLSRLDSVLFQLQLGTLRDKTDRLQALAGWVAGQIGAPAELARRAGLLSKCDLMTNMVREFPGTQGVMGMHYARHDGEAEEVALALHEHYLPRFSGDILPSTALSCALAIADKMDTLTGILGTGQYPKGDKDPFALRRAALGVLRIIVANKWPLDLQTLAAEAARLYGNRLTNTCVADEVVDFMLGRFRSWYQEEGYATDTIQAVLIRRPTRPADFDARVNAVSWFRTQDAASALAAANKRVANMLVKSAVRPSDQIYPALLKEPAEKKLATRLAELHEHLDPLLVAGRYQDVLMALAGLRETVDDFFDTVTVMDADDATRINRLTLLGKLRELFLQVADIALLQNL